MLLEIHLLTPVALFGLLLLPLIVLLHLRRRQSHPEVVPSLLLWQDVLGEPVQGTRRLGMPSLPLLLLQLLAVAALVFSLAHMESTAGPPDQRVYIFDASIHMAASDGRLTRLQEARQRIEQLITAAPTGTLFTIVVATAQPYLLISTEDRDRALQALQSVAATNAQADLPTALRLADGTLVDSGARNVSMLLLHAPEEPLPPVAAPPRFLATLAVGRSMDNQAILQSRVRCSTGAGSVCVAYVTVRNEADRTVVDPLVIEGDGTPLSERSLSLPAHSSAGIRFVVPPGRHALRMYLARADILPQDNGSWAVVGGASPRVVTLVGDPARIAPLQRAFAALPGVKVRSLEPARYTAVAAAGSDLLVLDGWLPPPSPALPPALLLIDPRRIPGGSVDGTLSDASISGLDGASSLVAGVDLTSLDIPQGVAHRLMLPAGVSPVVWAADGPLLGAGISGGQRVAVLAFDPLRSNLTNLDALPILLRNILNWSSTWLPPSASAGENLLLEAPPGTSEIVVTGMGLPGAAIPRTVLALTTGRPGSVTFRQPGLYTVQERGPWGIRTGQIAVGTGEQIEPAPASVQPIMIGPVGLPSHTNSSIAGSVSWWPWLAAIALLLVILEWLYVALYQEA